MAIRCTRKSLIVGEIKIYSELSENITEACGFFLDSRVDYIEIN